MLSDDCPTAVDDARHRLDADRTWARWVPTGCLAVRLAQITRRGSSNPLGNRDLEHDRGRSSLGSLAGVRQPQGSKVGPACPKCRLACHQRRRASRRA